MKWYVYLAHCNDDTVYTGITTDLRRREAEHNTDNKLGAKSLRSKRPVRIVYSETYDNQGLARRREADIKSWKRIYKLRLISEFTRKNTN